MSRQERINIINEIEAKRDSKLICYITSDRRNLEARIAKDVLPYLYEHLRKLGHIPKIDLLIYTNGGDTLAGFGIVNKIREFCQSFSVLVPFKALSCGTLICLGADEIVMTEMGTLSPIDPTVTTDYNPIGSKDSSQTAGKLFPLSVEDVVAFIKLAKEEAHINNLEQVFISLADKVHPVALGRVFRTREQIIMLGRNLLSLHKNKLDTSEIDRIVNYLSRELGSHDYEISRTEAKNKLRNVKDAVPDVADLMWALIGHYRRLMELDTTFDPEIILGKNLQAKYGTVLAVLESVVRCDFFNQEFDFNRVNIPQPQGFVAQGVQQRITKAGWEELIEESSAR